MVCQPCSSSPDMYLGFYKAMVAEHTRLLSMRIADTDSELALAADACLPARIEVIHAPVQALYRITPPFCPPP